MSARQPKPWTPERHEACKARANAATKGPWKWWTSNSHRRLTAEDRQDGGVAYGTKHKDGCGDIVIGEADMAFTEHAREDVPDMLAKIESLTADVEFYKRRERDICAALGGVGDGGKYRNDIIDAIRCRLRPEGPLHEAVKRGIREAMLALCGSGVPEEHLAHMLADHAMSGGCDHERSDEERALDRLRAEVRRLTAEVERLSRSEAACVREALEQVGVARAERDDARAEIARLNAELAKLRALKSAEVAPVIERFMAAFGADMPQAPSGTTEPLRRGLILRKATRGSVEIGVVLGPSRFTADAVDVLIGWVTDPGVGGIATLRFSQIERGIWRVASAQDAALARVNLAVPERDHRGRILTAVDATVLTEPLGPPLSLPIARPWDEEAQRIVDTAPEDGT